jgi:TolB-like protein
LALLAALLAAGGRAVDKSELMDAAWPGLAVEESNLSVQIAVLRRLLGPAPDGAAWIETVPRVGYRFAGNAIVEGGVPTTSEPKDNSPRLSIAVVPFQNVSGDPEQEYFADGITDDIITSLARFRWFSVASRGTSFAYKGLSKDSKTIGRDLGVAFLLEGSVRRTGPGVRVTAQLVEGINGTTVWSEQYNVEDAEIFAVQDAIAERVTGAVEPELLRHDSIRVAHHTGNLSAWDLVRRGTWNFHKVTKTTHLEARRLFREACLLDGLLAEPQFWTARVNVGLVAYGWSNDPESDRREGLDAALRAIYLDGQNPYSHYSLAMISVYSDRLPQAMLAAERAIDLSPNFALGHLVLGMAHLIQGNAKIAIGPLAHGLGLNPHDPQNAAWFNMLALARFFAGDAAGALDTARTALKTRPDSRPLTLMLAYCHAANGHWDDARRTAQLAATLRQDARDPLEPLLRQHQPAWERHVQDLLAEIG